MVKNKTKRVKKIVNRQKVANNPSSIARVVQVDSKGIRKFFFIRSIISSDRVGDLCFLKTWCFDFKNKTVKRKLLRLKNTDIIHPYLTTELVYLCKTKNLKVPQKLMTRLSIMPSLKSVRKS